MNIEKTTAYLMDLVDDYRDTDKKCGSFTYNETTAKARDVLINGLREVLQCKACPATLEGYSPSGVESTHEQQAQAWRAVWEVLQEVNPGFDDCYPLSGQEAAVKAIRELAVVQQGVQWTPGENEWKSWCSKWFGPDADDDYLAKAVFHLPPMAQKFAAHPTQQGLEVPTQAACDVIEERARQIELGYDHSHDDAHADESIAAAAAVFIMPEECRDWDASSTTYGDTLAEALLSCDWGAPEFGTDRRAQLVKGAAMALAEIERIDRACAAQAKQGEQANG